MIVNEIINHNCINRAGVHDKGLVHSRVNVNPKHCQTIIKRSGNHKHNLFKLGSWNGGTLRGRAGEIEETLNRRKIDICCVQEV